MILATHEAMDPLAGRAYFERRSNPSNGSARSVGSRIKTFCRQPEKLEIPNLIDGTWIALNIRRAQNEFECTEDLYDNFQQGL